MTTQQTVRCPNCGSLAERWHHANSIQTECSACDYLMVTCSKTGNVLEAYAPGISVSDFVSIQSVLTLEPLARSLS
ncbi:MAG: pyruvate formate lyase-activating protein [Oscillatoriales cyanobacterium RM1_1_9]|nr:pyruvate formate lyase-activating protein [Oscillatoriales cyanobacterium SM2_3_0]NJO44491.1 pyruvate formate lyase-activating protein [Oscillatoriales cyanobacterium RM2_1_1]NJO70992.1 pyruvate formate lyase-activating protein [Oscillatoriales cyanobacterium RM1_1_9]